MKVILKELPNRNYKLTGHGILVRKEEINEQRGTTNDRNNVFTADQGPNFTNNGPTPTRQVTCATT